MSNKWRRKICMRWKGMKRDEVKGRQRGEQKKKKKKNRNRKRERYESEHQRE